MITCCDVHCDNSDKKVMIVWQIDIGFTIEKLVWIEAVLPSRALMYGLTYLIKEWRYIWMVSDNVIPPLPGEVHPITITVLNSPGFAATLHSMSIVITQRVVNAP